MHLYYQQPENKWQKISHLLKHFSPGHLAQLSDRRITAEEASRLKLKNGEAYAYDQLVSARGRG